MKNPTIMIGTKYGNEYKNHLENYVSPEILNQTATILSTRNFIVLNTSYWSMRVPWNVPERKISDNLIVVVKSGKLEAQTNGHSAVLSPGDCMMVPEFAPHSYGFPKGTAEAETFILHVLCDHPQNGNPFNSLNRPFFHLRHWEAKEEELLRIIALRNKSSDLAFSCAEQLVKRIFAELIETGICRFSLPAAPDPRIENALEFMRRNLSANLSIQDIAETAHLKEVQFRRLFHLACGISPAAWLHRLRLMHALRLLTRRNDPLSWIAQESGFNSLTYFCSSFRKFFHITPEQYRNRTGS